MMAIQFRIYSSAEAVGKEVWNRLAVAASPMMEWEYFHALEESGVVSEQRGYRPCHLVAYQDHQAIALAPLYERDRAWVEFGDGGLVELLSELTGIPYNCGIVGTIPYTPVPAYEFLHNPIVEPLPALRVLLDYLDYRLRKSGSCHFASIFRGFRAAASARTSAGEEDTCTCKRTTRSGSIAIMPILRITCGRSNRAEGPKSGGNGERFVTRESRSEWFPARMLHRNTSIWSISLYEKTWTKHMGSRIHPVSE